MKLITRAFLYEADACYTHEEIEKLVPEKGLTVHELCALDIPEDDILWVLLQPEVMAPHQQRELIYLWAKRYVGRVKNLIEPLPIEAVLPTLKRLTTPSYTRNMRALEKERLDALAYAYKKMVATEHKLTRHVLRVIAYSLHENAYHAVSNSSDSWAVLMEPALGVPREETYGVMVADALELLTKGE